MSWRRVVFAFAVTFVCALTVFTLPRFVFNTVSGAVRQTPAQDTAKAQPVPAAPVQPTPRSLGSRLTGLFGIILILGIGFAFARNQLARRRLGRGPASRVRDLRAACANWPGDLQLAWCHGDEDPQLLLCRLRIRLR